MSAASYRCVISTVRQCQKSRLVLYFLEFDTHVSAKIQVWNSSSDLSRLLSTSSELFYWRNIDVTPLIRILIVIKRRKVLVIEVFLSRIEHLFPNNYELDFFHQCPNWNQCLWKNDSIENYYFWSFHHNPDSQSIQKMFNIRDSSQCSNSIFSFSKDVISPTKFFDENFLSVEDGSK